MTTIVTKTIGNAAGRDFATLNAFALWLQVQDLVANDQMVYAYVYDNVPLANLRGAQLRCKTNSDKNYCVIQPAPGLGVNELSPSGALGYGDAGIELEIQVGSSSNNCLYIRGGVAVRGFRIRVYGTTADGVSQGGLFCGKSSGYDATRVPEVRFNRFWMSHTGNRAPAVRTGESGIGAWIADNLFIHTTGNGLSANVNYASFERNTIVRLDTAKGYSGTIDVNDTIRDNIFVGCGPIPAASLTATASAKITNNYTDAAMTTPNTGFTVVLEGSLLVNALSTASDFRLKSDSIAVGKGSTVAVKTKDLVGRYRGSVPDVGAYQANAQALPALPVATIDSQVIKDQTITFKGTITGEVLSGVARISKEGLQVGTDLTPVVTGNKFEVTFAFIPGGNYDSPIIKFNNDGGEGPAASNALPFFIANPVIPTAVITKQYIVGTKLTVVGTVSGAPQSGTIRLDAAAAPNDGAVSQPSAAISINGNTFVASIKGIPTGKYAAPAINLTNGAGTGPNATGGGAVTVVPVVIPPVPGVNVQLIGVGQTHATMRDFASWLRAYNLIANGQIVHAYVCDDQAFADTTNAYFLAEGGSDQNHYCVIRPAPGMGVNDLLANEKFNYGDVGIELTVGVANGIKVGPNVSLEGFRINVFNNAEGASTRRAISITSDSHDYAPSISGALRKNRIRGSVPAGTAPTSASSRLAFIHTGEYGTTGQITDNYIEIASGDGLAIITGGNSLIMGNTFVRRNAKPGVPLFQQGNGSIQKNNLFVDCGPMIVDGAANSSTIIYSNNFTNVDQTTARAGLTYTNLALVASTTDDFRPKAGGPAIAAASSEALSTTDIVGKNRGTGPDVGAWQLNAFVATPTAAITSTDVDGTDVTIRGTTTNSPTSGVASMLKSASDPAGAVDIGNTAVTIKGDGTFEVKWENISPGNYQPAVIRFSNAGGLGPVATGATTVSIIEIGGNPGAPEIPEDGGGTPPTISLTEKSIVLQQFRVAGEVYLQGDPAGKVEVFIDSIPTGTTEGPFPATVVDAEWEYVGTTTLLKYRVRVVATANGSPALAAQTFSVVKASNAIPLPLK